MNKKDVIELIKYFGQRWNGCVSMDDNVAEYYLKEFECEKKQGSEE